MQYLYKGQKKADKVSLTTNASGVPGSRVLSWSSIFPDGSVCSWIGVTASEPPLPPAVLGRDLGRNMYVMLRLDTHVDLRGSDSASDGCPIVKDK
jgi:hypothetical protein